MIAFCKQRGIVVTAYAPFGRPGSNVNYMRHDVPSLLEDQKLKEIAMKHGKTAAQVILRYLVSICNAGTGHTAVSCEYLMLAQVILRYLVSICNAGTGHTAVSCEYL
jgi:hypothetical protein